MKDVKRILMAVTAMVSFTTSCCLRGDYSPYRGKEYLYYSDDIVDNCIEKPMAMLDFVLMVKNKVSGPIENGTYIVADDADNKIGPFECRVEGSDTVWYADNIGYIISQSDVDKNTWVVRRDDSISGVSGWDYLYKYTLTAAMSSEYDSALAHQTWDISIQGERFEKSDYSLSYCSEGLMTIMWNYPNAYYTNCTINGVLDVSFRKNGKEKDWLKALYQDGDSHYQTSFR